MRYGERAGRPNVGMCQQRLVDLARGDLLATTVDDLLQTSGDRDVPIGVDATLITGSEPALDERSRVGVRIVDVAGHDGRALDRELADLAGGKAPAIQIQYSDVDAGCSAHRAWSSRFRRQRIARHLVCGLGHAVGLDDRRTERAF